jgi:hypothetical protein
MHAMRHVAFVALLALPLFGCPLESKEPLAPPTRALFDRTLLGRWRCIGFGVGDDADKVWPLEFRAADEGEYQIFAAGMGKDGEDITCRAYATRVHHVPILNVQTDADSWIFIRYMLHGDGVLHLQNLEDRMGRSEKTGKALRHVIARRIHDPRLFQDLFICARADRETTPQAPPPDTTPDTEPDSEPPAAPQ